MVVADELLQDLWFHQAAGVVVAAFIVHQRRVTVHAATTSGSAPSPSCATVSGRVHSRYVRRLDDASVGGRPVLAGLPCLARGQWTAPASLRRRVAPLRPGWTTRSPVPTVPGWCSMTRARRCCTVEILAVVCAAVDLLDRVMVVFEQRP